MDICALWLTAHLPHMELRKKNNKIIIKYTSTGLEKCRSCDLGSDKTADFGIKFEFKKKKGKKRRKKEKEWGKRERETSSKIS